MSDEDLKFYEQVATALEIELGTKALPPRHVRTAAGAAAFHVPIGAPIVEHPGRVSALRMRLAERRKRRGPNFVRDIASGFAATAGAAYGTLTGAPNEHEEFAQRALRDARSGVLSDDDLLSALRLAEVGPHATPEARAHIAALRAIIEERARGARRDPRAEAHTIRRAAHARTLAAIGAKGLDDEWLDALEEKGIFRRVRTAEGARVFHQPVGSVIKDEPNVPSVHHHRVVEDHRTHSASDERRVQATVERERHTDPVEALTRLAGGRYGKPARDIQSALDRLTEALKRGDADAAEHALRQVEYGVESDARIDKRELSGAEIGVFGNVRRHIRTMKKDGEPDDLETKVKTRRVRTPEGARLYGLPIGAVITPDVVPNLSSFAARGMESGQRAAADLTSSAYGSIDSQPSFYNEGVQIADVMDARANIEELALPPQLEDDRARALDALDMLEEAIEPGWEDPHTGHGPADALISTDALDYAREALDALYRGIYGGDEDLGDDPDNARWLEDESPPSDDYEEGDDDAHATFTEDALNHADAVLPDEFTEGASGEWEPGEGYGVSYVRELGDDRRAYIEVEETGDGQFNAHIAVYDADDAVLWETDFDGEEPDDEGGDFESLTGDALDDARSKLAEKYHEFEGAFEFAASGMGSVEYEAQIDDEHYAQLSVNTDGSGAYLTVYRHLGEEDEGPSNQVWGVDLSTGEEFGAETTYTLDADVKAAIADAMDAAELGEDDATTLAWMRGPGREIDMDETSRDRLASYLQDLLDSDMLDPEDEARLNRALRALGADEQGPKEAPDVADDVRGMPRGHGRYVGGRYLVSNGDGTFNVEDDLGKKLGTVDHNSTKWRALRGGKLVFTDSLEAAVDFVARGRKDLETYEAVADFMDLECKAGTRRVRTAEGAREYGRPIGSVITSGPPKLLPGVGGPGAGRGEDPERARRVETRREAARTRERRELDEAERGSQARQTERERLARVNKRRKKQGLPLVLALTTAKSLEGKVRRVRTPEGARLFGLPIGSPIVGRPEGVSLRDFAQHTTPDDTQLTGAELDGLAIAVQAGQSPTVDDDSQNALEGVSATLAGYAVTPDQLGAMRRTFDRAQGPDALTELDPEEVEAAERALDKLERRLGERPNAPTGPSQQDIDNDLIEQAYYVAEGTPCENCGRTDDWIGRARVGNTVWLDCDDCGVGRTAVSVAAVRDYAARDGNPIPPDVTSNAPASSPSTADGPESVGAYKLKAGDRVRHQRLKGEAIVEYVEMLKSGNARVTFADGRKITMPSNEQFELLERKPPAPAPAPTAKPVKEMTDDELKKEADRLWRLPRIRKLYDSSGNRKPQAFGAVRDKDDVRLEAIDKERRTRKQAGTSATSAPKKTVGTTADYAKLKKRKAAVKFYAQRKDGLSKDAAQARADAYEKHALAELEAGRPLPLNPPASVLQAEALDKASTNILAGADAYDKSKKVNAALDARFGKRSKRLARFGEGTKKYWVVLAEPEGGFPADDKTMEEASGRYVTRDALEGAILNGSAFKTSGGAVVPQPTAPAGPSYRDDSKKTKYGRDLRVGDVVAPGPYTTGEKPRVVVRTQERPIAAGGGQTVYYADGSSERFGAGYGAHTTAKMGQVEVYTRADPLPKGTRFDHVGPDNALTVVETLKADLAAAGLPRTSNLTGGEMTGWTETQGSTGFSVGPGPEPGTYRVHMVVSGEAAGVQYEEWTEYRDDGDAIELHRPVNVDKLLPRIRQVLAARGLDVTDVKNSGYQMHWDDDLNFTATVREKPKGLSVALELKARHVRTAEGAALYGLPIGSVIKPGTKPSAAGREAAAEVRRAGAHAKRRAASGSAGRPKVGTDRRVRADDTSPEALGKLRGHRVSVSRKKGDSLSGTIVEVTSTGVTLRTDDGERVKVRHSAVTGMDRDTEDADEWGKPTHALKAREDRLKKDPEYRARFDKALAFVSQKPKGKYAALDPTVTNPEYGAYVDDLNRRVAHAMADPGPVGQRPDGELTAQGMKLSRRIAREEIESVQARRVPQDRRVIMAAGISGAGKTTVLKSDAGSSATGIEFETVGDETRPRNYAVANADDMKERMKPHLPPEYAELGINPDEATSLVHEVSSQANKIYLQALIDGGYNTILDGTYEGKPEKRDREARAFKSAGYKVMGLLVDGDLETSMLRATARHTQPPKEANDDLAEALKHVEPPDGGFRGRYVPLGPVVVNEQAPDERRAEEPSAWGSPEWKSANAQNFQTSIETDHFDAWVVFDSNQRVVGKSENQEQAWTGVAPAEGQEAQGAAAATGPKTTGGQAEPNPPTARAARQAAAGAAA